MKERPILFSAPMVRAILEGRKTVTRRIIKPTQPRADGLWPAGRDPLPDCPYGQPGDRLWVRETWMVDAPRDGTWADFSFYGCKGSPLSEIPERYRKPEHCLFRATWDGFDMVGWKPSIHMPRWASRITLEVTGVRVERLQDITPDQAISEGIEGMRPSSLCATTWRDYSMSERDPFEWFGNPADSFRSLWESINGADNWAANPWVWVVEFKRVQP